MLDTKLINGLMDVMTDKSIKWDDFSILDLFQKEKEGHINLKLSNYYDDIERDSLKIIKKNTETGFEIWMYIPFRHDKKPYVLVNTIDKFILINDINENSISYVYNYRCYGIDDWYANCFKKEFEEIIINHQKLDGYKIIMAKDFIKQEQFKMQQIVSKKIKDLIESDKSINSINNDYYKDYYQKQLKNKKNKIQATIDLLKDNPERKLVDCSYVSFDDNKNYLEIVYDICRLYEYIINPKDFDIMVDKRFKEILEKDELGVDSYYKYAYIDTLVNNTLREIFHKKPWKMMKLDKMLLSYVRDVKQFIVESKKSKIIHIIKTMTEYDSFYKTIENSKIRKHKKEIEDIDESYMKYIFPCVLDITKITDIDGKILYTNKK